MEWDGIRPSTLLNRHQSRHQDGNPLGVSGGRLYRSGIFESSAGREKNSDSLASSWMLHGCGTAAGTFRPFPTAHPPTGVQARGNSSGLVRRPPVPRHALLRLGWEPQAVQVFGASHPHPEKALPLLAYAEVIRAWYKTWTFWVFALSRQPLSTIDRGGTSGITSFHIHL